MSQKIVIERNSRNSTDRTHASFLVPFFTEMNARFTGKWCVLHSYDTLPYYSESDVDMAFAGSSLQNLEILINEVAARTGWQLYQKLWYDVQWCCYYVLREKTTGTLLAIDFLTDNYGIGRYGFKTTILTKSCMLVNDLIPVPNHETALSYKLVKRIEKERSLADDDTYIKAHFLRSDQQKIASFLNWQYGAEGGETVLSYLKKNRGPLTDAEMVALRRERRKRIFTLKNRSKFVRWETLRIVNRIQYPSGMLVNIPILEEKKMVAFTKVLKQKVGILFRFVALNKSNSTFKKFKGITGSTLFVCPQAKFDPKKAVRYHGLNPKYVAVDIDGNLAFDDLELVTDTYLAHILMALSIRLSSKLYTNG